MKELKEHILKVITPKAVLLPLTEEAKKSIINDPCETFLIRMSNFPYKIGRESRVGENEKGLFVKFRIIKNITKPRNDTYLYNVGKDLQISKEHLEISKNENNYILKDRGSSNGTTINEITYGGNRKSLWTSNSRWRYYWNWRQQIKVQIPIFNLRRARNIVKD